MHFQLSSEQTMIVDTVRTFVEKELYPHEDEVERTDAIPPELAKSIQAKARAHQLNDREKRSVAGKRCTKPLHHGIRARFKKRISQLLNQAGFTDSRLTTD
jgi:alkylation response protein AidB-like acyl-CoA dehydrogenase